ncbi:MAG TPA: 5'-3' exonuclease [Actinomycetota bacterium]|nr:5'-3' exonuclease [Actinomycetota bacterium]
MPANNELTLLVDASSLIYRAFFSTPDSIKTPDGRTINGAYGFLNMLSQLIAGRKPRFLACASDEAWRPQWRVDLIDTYKTHRTEDLRAATTAYADDELAHQTPIAFQLLTMSGIAVVGTKDFEAEDVIGSLAVKASGKVIIVSGDRDLFQLVRDPYITVMYPKRGVSEVIMVDEAYIEKKYGIPGRSYGDFALLRGDPSDGLPGVPGIGEKTAAGLIAKYGSIERVLEAAIGWEGTGPLGKVRSALDYIDRAAKVVFITCDAPVPQTSLEMPEDSPPDEAFALAEEHGLSTPFQRVTEAIKQAAGRATAQK